MVGCLNSYRLFLASVSPRRRRLLELMGLRFEVAPSSVDEACVAGETPVDFARNAAREKCADVAGSLSARGALVLGADTIVCVDLSRDRAAFDAVMESGGKGFRVFPDCRVVLNKPTDAGEAGRMLRLLSDRVHCVVTGVALWHGGAARVVHEASDVRFRCLGDGEIAQYIATGEPMDKAGSYGIQGRAAAFIESVAGDRSNVIGLPVVRTAELLRPFFADVRIPDDAELARAYES